MNISNDQLGLPSVSDNHMTRRHRDHVPTYPQYDGTKFTLKASQGRRRTPRRSARRRHRRRQRNGGGEGGALDHRTLRRYAGGTETTAVYDGADPFNVAPPAPVSTVATPVDATIGAEITPDSASMSNQSVAETAQPISDETVVDSAAETVTEPLAESSETFDNPTPLPVSETSPEIDAASAANLAADSSETFDNSIPQPVSETIAAKLSRPPLFPDEDQDQESLDNAEVKQSQAVEVDAAEPVVTTGEPPSNVVGADKITDDDSAATAATILDNPEIAADINALITKIVHNVLQSSQAAAAASNIQTTPDALGSVTNEMQTAAAAEAS